MDDWDNYSSDSFDDSDSCNIDSDDTINWDSNQDFFLNNNDIETEAVKQKKTKVFSKSKTVAAIVGGILGGFLGNATYNSLIDSLWKPFVVALFLLIVAICIFIPTNFVSANCSDIQKNKSSTRKIMVKLNVMCLVAIFLLGILFEFLYEICGGFKNGEPTSYIFVLDTSSSMESTDNNHQMSEALQTIITDMDDGFPFAVYSFNDTVINNSEMHVKTVKDDGEKWPFQYTGSTEMFLALSTVLEDYGKEKDKQNWIGGKNPRVILISDGNPTDSGFFNTSINKIIKSFRKKGISISTIGVRGANDGLMKKIAESTGGAYISIDNIDSLQESINEVQNKTTDCTLFSLRFGRNHDIILAIMRILFLTILGCFFIGPIYCGNAIEDDFNVIMISKLVTGIIGAVGVEILFQNTNISDNMLRISFGLICSLAPLSTYARRNVSNVSKQHYSSSNYANQSNTSPNTLEDDPSERNDPFRLD